MAEPLVEIPIKLKLRGGLHDDVIEFFQAIPNGSRAATVVAVMRAYLSGDRAGVLPGQLRLPHQAEADEIYAALIEML